jgi:hypothetical protein
VWFFLGVFFEPHLHGIQVACLPMLWVSRCWAVLRTQQGFRTYQIKNVMVAKEAITSCQSSFDCNHDERVRFACPSVFVVSKTSKAVVLSLRHWNICRKRSYQHRISSKHRQRLSSAFCTLSLFWHLWIEGSRFC